MSIDTLIPTASNRVEENDGLENAFEYVSQPDYTYKLNIDAERIAGYVDELEAYKQAIYKIINTERYDHIIYSRNYGVELKELFGQPIPYVIPEIERRIKEAIEQDDRTESVDSFEFDTSKRGVVHVTFKAKSVYGSVAMETNVEV